MIELVFGGPFRILDRAISFRFLQERKGQNLFSEQARSKTDKFISYLSVPFYFRYWVFKTFGFYVFSCCFSMKAKLKKSSDTNANAPNFEQAMEFFDELENAFKWHMSIARESVEDLEDRIRVKNTMMKSL